MFEDPSLLCTGQEEPGGEVRFKLSEEQPARVESHGLSLAGMEPGRAVHPQYP